MSQIRGIHFILILLILLSCQRKKDQDQLKSELKSIDLLRGDIALCGSENDEFGTVNFNVSCSEKVKKNFNLATALLHSFEYAEAEKEFAKVIDEDPQCLMGYWGVAMCNFHPLWMPPGRADLEKGSKVIALGRSVKSKSTRETDYLEAIATIYDQWDKQDYHSRALKFEKATEKIMEKYPEDHDAAIFYALALCATADPTDKSFSNQRKAGEILNTILTKEPGHPGIAHYIIHTYDYPELAQLALPAARKYASLAAASAHAQHMPSHIFTRLGLWDEAIHSNLNSVSAAQCYAQNLGMKGHSDEELHALDYLVYAYLQEARDDEALESLKYLMTISEVFPLNFKDAYAFAAIPVRYALERKDWKYATSLELRPANFPWEKFPWEQSSLYFGRLLGAVHTHQPEIAQEELKKLNMIHNQLQKDKEDYKANQVLIQIKASEGWMEFAKGHRHEALQLMMDAAAMEDSTEKHSVSPGEVIPARELLGDMYIEMGDPSKALEAYESDLKRHPNRFNGLYGAGLAEERSGNNKKAIAYYKQLLVMTDSSMTKRPQRIAAEAYVTKNK